MQQLVQVLVGGLVVFVAAMWSLPNLRRMQANRRQAAIDRTNRDRALASNRSAANRPRSRDLVGELGKVAEVDLRSEPLVLAGPNGGRRKELTRVELKVPAVDREAPELSVRLPECPPTPEPIDIASLFDPDAPVDPDLVEGELVGPTEPDADSATDAVDAVIVEDDDDALREELKAILPARQPGATLATIEHLELDESLLSELLGPAEELAPIPDLGLTTPSAQFDLHDVWGSHGSDHDVLVKALQALSTLDD